MSNDWLPNVAQHDGRSLQRMTLLSPIFYLSCFAEDDIDMLVTQFDQINEQDIDDADDVTQVFHQYFNSLNSRQSRVNTLSLSLSLPIESSRSIGI
jgi:hypothetical protein